jgi:uncharacterized protein
MSAAWSQLHDIDRLADGQIGLDFAIPLTAFARLPPQPVGTGEVLSGHAQFRREGSVAVAELAAQGAVHLVCQRCMKPMRFGIDSHARIALVASEPEADRVPPEFEPMHAPEGRIRLKDLVEEEVLVTLPIVPLHEDLRDCTPAAQAAETPAESESPMQKPFERLGELLKRKD